MDANANGVNEQYERKIHGGFLRAHYTKMSEMMMLIFQDLTKPQEGAGNLGPLPGARGMRYFTPQ